MKKLIIAVAALVGLGLGLAHAEGVDFDGKTIGPMSFMEAIKNTDSSQNDNIVYEQPKPVAVSLGNIGETIFSPRIVIAVDEAIKSVISSSAAYKNQLVKENLEQLLKIGTFEQKYEFVYGNETVYHFPSLKDPGVAHMLDGRITNTGTVKSLTHACIETVSETICVDKTVCKYTCILMGGAAAVYGSVNGVWQIIIPAQIATEVCKDICANVPLCTTSERCVKWDLI